MKINLWGGKMKKLFLIICLFLLIFVTGCGKTNEENVIKKLTNKVDGLKAYQLSGELSISNNEDTYNYLVDVSFAKNDKFRVSLKNKANDHEQIILKNDDGVFVLTPSLNKSFKFQSDWPYNNSQVYLLGSIVDDLSEDQNATVKKENSDYVITSKVVFANNNNLVKQKVTVDKDLNFKKVVILDSNDIPQMTMTFKTVDLKPNFSENHFEISEIMNNTKTNTETNTSKLEDIIYPLYIPTGTSLTDQEKVTKTDGERVILTFEGEKPFILVEETVSVEDELTTIPTYGEPYLLIDTIGALTDTSVSWISNGIEYYLVSDVMSQTELLEVAKSIATIPVSK